MNLFNQGMIQLILLILLPLTFVFGLCYYILGATFLWGLGLFLLGSFFLLRSFNWLSYSPSWLKKIKQLRVFKSPSRLSLFFISVLSCLFLFIVLIQSLFSEEFCLTLLAAYATLSWIFYRLSFFHIVYYSRWLSIDSFNHIYWFFMLTHLSYERTYLNATGLFSFFKKAKFYLFHYQEANAEHQVKAIDILFKKKYYDSLIQLQKKLFVYCSEFYPLPAVRKKILHSIHRLEKCLAQEDVELQEEQLEAIYTNNDALQNAQLYLLLDIELIQEWFVLIKQENIHLTIAQSFYDTVGDQLSRFIQSPSNFNLFISTIAYLSDKESLVKIEYLADHVPFEEESEIGNSIRYVYNLLRISHGIARNMA